MKKTIPPKKSESEAIQRFENAIKILGEAAAMLDNLERVAKPAFEQKAVR